MARPPGGSVEQPVVNCRKAFLSSDDIPQRTRTNRRKPGLRGRKRRRRKRKMKIRRVKMINDSFCIERKL